MSAPMKKHPTDEIAHVTWHGYRYAVPCKIIEQYKISSDTNTHVSVDDVFSDLINEHGEPGVLLRGLRCKEGLTQVELSKHLAITQANLSAMENGRREIGKVIAKRIAKQFSMDYRFFL